MGKPVLVSSDGMADGMANTFPNGDTPVMDSVLGTSPFDVGVTPISMILNGNNASEILVQIDGADGKNCYLCFSKDRDADETKDIKFPVGTILSLPNKGNTLRALGDDASIKLKMFYSQGA